MYSYKPIYTTISINFR